MKHANVEGAARRAVFETVQRAADRRADDAAIGGGVPCLFQCGERGDLAYVEIVRGGFHEAIGIDAAVEEARKGAAQIAFLLKPTSVEQVAKISFGGGVMPQKSTDFYPKLLSGFVMYKIN